MKWSWPLLRARSKARSARPKVDIQRVGSHQGILFHCGSEIYLVVQTEPNSGVFIVVKSEESPS